MQAIFYVRLCRIQHFFLFLFNGNCSFFSFTSLLQVMPVFITEKSKNCRVSFKHARTLIQNMDLIYMPNSTY